MGKTLWTEERIARLTELWKLRVTSTVIAKEFGMTRSAIMGKVHRLGLFGKGPPKKPPPPKGKKRMLRKPSPSVSHETPPPQESKPVGPLNCKLIDLTENSCRWPIGDPQDWDNFCYCGAQRYENKPYCVKHWKASWGKTA